MRTWCPAGPARVLLATTLLLSGPAATLTAQTDVFEATAIARAAGADHEFEDTGTLAACVGILRPGASEVRNPTRRVLDLAEGMLDQRPAPWRPGDSIAVAQLTPVSRCERMRARRDRLAEAAGREYAPVRFILVEVEDLGPYGGLGITVRYRGDAEGEFRCSVTGYPDGPPYACSSADTGGDSTGRTREESRALQVRVLATWMDANPEVTVCLAGLAKSSSRDTPTAPDLELRRPARSDLHAIGRLLSDRYPTRVAPYCVPARDGHPTSALDELHLRAERRRECEALRSSVAAAESRGASPRETDRILGAGAMSNCYPSPAELVDPYGRPAARLAISAPAFQTHGPARVMMSPSFHTSRREYQLCSFERLEDGWAATPECESSVYSH